MNTHYSSLIKSGAQSIGNDAMSQSIFSKIDKDKNGQLSQLEIDNASSSFQEIFNDAVKGFKDIATNLFGGENKVLADNAPPDQSDAPNGKVDKDFKQGQTGDCWLLSAIAAKASTPEGQADLNKMLSVDDKGNVTVELGGKQYTYEKALLESYPELSSGDLDVRALELAIEDRRIEKRQPKNFEQLNNILDGGYTYEMFNELHSNNVIAETHCFEMNGNAINIIKNNNEKDGLLGKIAMVAATDEKSDLSKIKVLDENNNSIKLYNKHAYAVINADDNYVYLKNPHDTSHTLKMSHDDFNSAFVEYAYQKANMDIPKMPEIKLE